jgi:predicted nucleotidyltransferase
MNRFDPRELLRALAERKVRFVVIGGVAANLQGSTSVTLDLDVLYARDKENLEALAAVLKSVGARPRRLERGLPYRLDAQALRNGSNFTLETSLGDLDCLGEASGGFTYERVVRAAERLEVEGTELLVVSLDDLIRMKRAAGRNKDRIEVENLSALREVRDQESRE